MKTQTYTRSATVSSLTSAIAMIAAIWLPLQAQSAEPAEGKMMEGNATQSCQEMKDQKLKMAAEMRVEDAALTAQVAKMNGAPEAKKLDLAAAVLTRMVEQRTAMNEQMETTHEKMMQHMTQHMQMGKESMSQCPMMEGMKEMDAKSGNDQKAQN